MTTTAPVAPTATLDLAALQRGLAAEHAALWAYGVVGAHLDGAAEKRARDFLEEHRVWRDRLEALVADAGARPVAAQPAYALPSPVIDAADAVALAERVEQAAAAVWADVVATLHPDRRRVAAEALRDAAVRAARWRAAPTAFPGLPERAAAPSPSR